MAKKGGRNRMKRLSAPRQWDISRKGDRFVPKPAPGPHSTEESYPLGVVIHDLLGLVANRRELKQALSSGEVIVDGRVRSDISFPVGLFNVVDVPKEGVAYRLLPSPDGLVSTKVEGDQKHLKLCKIRSKVKITDGHIQYGFHDGRTLVNDKLNLSPGDAVLLKVPDQEVVSSIKLQKGSLGLVLSGDRAGQTGKIEELRKGSVTREKMVVLSLPSGSAELPARLVFPVGTDKPVIGVQVSAS